MILSSIFSSSSSVASLFPALSFESTCFAEKENSKVYYMNKKREHKLSFTAGATVRTEEKKV